MNLGKGKSGSRVQTTTEEIQYLMDFHRSISLAVAKILEHLSDFVFISTANLIFTRKDSYLAHV